MKYTKEERLDIGRRIYEGSISKNQAAEEYGISPNRARDYMRLYRDDHQLPPKTPRRSIWSESNNPPKLPETPTMADYETLTKEELIRELMKSRIEQERLKKGYEVRGDGTTKEYIPIGSKNTK